MLNPVFSYAQNSGFHNAQKANKITKPAAGSVFFGQAKALTNDDYRRLFNRENGVTFYGSHREVSEGEANFLKGFAQKLATTVNRDTGKHFFLVSPAGPGAMRVVAEAAKNAGAHVCGAAMSFEGEASEVELHPEYYMHPTFESRVVGKGGYLDRGGRTMPGTGGWGTLKELLELGIRLDKGQIPGTAQRAAALLDYENFYSKEGGFMTFMDFLKERGALPKGFDPRKFYIPVQTPDEMMDKVFQKSKKEIPWAKPNKKLSLHRDPYSLRDTIQTMNGIVVAKPGDWETVEAVLDIALKYFQNHGKAGLKRKIVLVDTDGFYSQGLLKHLQYLVDHKKLYPECLQMYETVPTMEAAKQRTEELSTQAPLQFGQARPRLQLVG